MILYRPIGMKELEKIAQSGFRAFPPRRPEQPTFYPVLVLEYARHIARQWNTKDPRSDYAGFVSRFALNDDYAAQFEIKIVGNQDLHRELWIPAEELETFNQNIIGDISIVEAYYGELFDGKINPETNLPVDICNEQ